MVTQSEHARYHSPGIGGVVVFVVLIAGAVLGLGILAARILFGL